MALRPFTKSESVNREKISSKLRYLVNKGKLSYEDIHKMVDSGRISLMESFVAIMDENEKNIRHAPISDAEIIRKALENRL